jgi:hypothetical protein
MSQDLSWREAIIAVLKDSPNPIHYNEIADEIVQRKLRTELGATPASTVNAIIGLSFKDDGDNSPFVRTARGYYALRSLPAPSPAALVQSEVSESESESSEITGVVNAFGMFWDRSKVLWEPQPRIFGQQQSGATEVDFCEQKGVYLLHDLQGVVYVGRVSDQNMGRRLYQHTSDRLNSRWTRFSWFGVFPVEANGSLKLSADFSKVDINVVIATMEAVLIEGLEPRQNRRRGDEFQAVEFLQYEDPRLQLQRKLSIIQELTNDLRTR